jgi:hypothetical protein
MGLTGCPQTSVANHHPTPCNIPEEQRPQGGTSNTVHISLWVMSSLDHSQNIAHPNCTFKNYPIVGEQQTPPFHFERVNNNTTIMKYKLKGTPL